MEREADAERRASPRPAAERGSDLGSRECGEAKSARRQRGGAGGWPQRSLNPATGCTLCDRPPDVPAGSRTSEHHPPPSLWLPPRGAPGLQAGLRVLCPFSFLFSEPCWDTASGWRWVRGKPETDPWLRRGGWGCSASVEPPPSLSLRRCLSETLPLLGPNKSAHFCFSLRFFLQLLLKMIGLMTY